MEPIVWTISDNQSQFPIILEDSNGNILFCPYCPCGSQSSGSPGSKSSLSIQSQSLSSQSSKSQFSSSSSQKSSQSSISISGSGSSSSGCGPHICDTCGPCGTFCPVQWNILISGITLLGGCDDCTNLNSQFLVNYIGNCIWYNQNGPTICGTKYGILFGYYQPIAKPAGWYTALVPPGSMSIPVNGYELFGLAGTFYCCVTNALPSSPGTLPSALCGGLSISGSCLVIPVGDCSCPPCPTGSQSGPSSQSTPSTSASASSKQSSSSRQTSGSSSSGSSGLRICDSCCGCAGMSMPYQWTLVVSGVTTNIPTCPDRNPTNCAALNGTFTLTYVGSCTWQSGPAMYCNGSATPYFQLQCISGSWIILPPDSTAEGQFNLIGSFNCCGVNRFAGTGGGFCIENGATATITPVGNCSSPQCYSNVQCCPNSDDVLPSQIRVTFSGGTLSLAFLNGISVVGTLVGYTGGLGDLIYQFPNPISPGYNLCILCGSGPPGQTFTLTLNHGGDPVACASGTPCIFAIYFNTCDIANWTGSAGPGTGTGSACNTGVITATCTLP